MQSFLQLDCLSNGLLDFYTKWSIRVFVIPALLLGLVGLQYCYEWRRVGASAAAGIQGLYSKQLAYNVFKANAFVIVFLCCESATAIACSTNAPSLARSLKHMPWCRSWLLQPGLWNGLWFLVMHVVSHSVARSNRSCACHTDKNVLSFSSTAAGSVQTSACW